jgi:diguanylate cyclase (GGDEF)-like protein
MLLNLQESSRMRNMKKNKKTKDASKKANLASATEKMAQSRVAKSAQEQEVNQNAPTAATDALTGLANYRRLSETIESEIKRSERTARTFAVLIFDLDGMKRINDSHDHMAGDRALCRLADIFRFFCRSIDTVAWYGGDEFAIILPETGAKDTDAVGRRICECLSSDRENPLPSVRVGSAVYPEDGTTIETLFQAADRALYKLKHLRKSSKQADVARPSHQKSHRVQTSPRLPSCRPN